MEYIVKIVRAARRWEVIDAHVTDDLLRAEGAGEMQNLVASQRKRAAPQLQARLSIAVVHSQKTTALTQAWDFCLGTSIKLRPSSDFDERAIMLNSVKARSGASGQT